MLELEDGRCLTESQPAPIFSPLTIGAKRRLYS